MLCAKGGCVAVCGDVKALIRHVWMDHDVDELVQDEDIVEVVEDLRRRRDSLLSFTESTRNGSRRSVSVGPGKKARRRGEVIETFEVYPGRRD